MKSETGIGDLNMKKIDQKTMREWLRNKYLAGAVIYGNPGEWWVAFFTHNDFAYQYILATTRDDLRSFSTADAAIRFLDGWIDDKYISLCLKKNFKGLQK